MAYDCYCDYDAPEIHRSKIVCARKEHRCEECGEKIRVGERYKYSFSVYEGYPYSTYTCSHCRDIAKWVQNNVPCFCWFVGSMLDDAKECIDEAYYRAPDEVRGVRFGFGRLLVKAKRYRAALNPAA